MSVDSFMRSSSAIRYEPPPAAQDTAALVERRRRRRRAADVEPPVLAGICRWLVNREPQPHIVVDSCLNILLANAAAQRLLADARTISASAGRLLFCARRSQAELSRVVNENLEQASFMVRTGSGVETVLVVRLPLRQGASRLLLITITCATSPQCDLLQIAFGLTRAEAQIALAIFRGLSLAGVATQRQASINTVKTQLRYIFQKLGVHSQAGVTRRVSEILS